MSEKHTTVRNEFYKCRGCGQVVTFSDERETMLVINGATKEGSIFSIVATVPVFAYVTLSDLRCKKMAINKDRVYQLVDGVLTKTSSDN